MSRISNELMSLIKDALKLELPSFVLTEGSSSGDPTLLIAEDSTPAAGEEVAFLKIIQKEYSGFPIPSLASADDGRPHKMQLVVEESATADVSVWKSIDFAKMMARLLEMNVDFMFYMCPNGTLPAEAEIKDANFVGEIRADVRHPNSGQ